MSAPGLSRLKRFSRLYTGLEKEGVRQTPRMEPTLSSVLCQSHPTLPCEKRKDGLLIADRHGRRTHHRYL